jgi:hypothetical protein
MKKLVLFLFIFFFSFNFAFADELLRGFGVYDNPILIN